MSTEWEASQKAQHGTFATIIWIAGSIVLFLYDGGIRNLFSLQAFAFIAIGMFVAAVVVGNVGNLLLRWATKLLMKKYPLEHARTRAGTAKIKAWGYLLFVVDITIAFGFVLLCCVSLF